MLDPKEFAQIAKEFSKKDALRDAKIQTSRQLIKQSKVVINAVHTGDLKKANKESKKLNNLKKQLDKTQSNSNNHGQAHVAYQEYVEATTYLAFAEKRKIPSRKKLGVKSETYVAGLCDLTGELIRKSLNEIMQDHYDFALDTKKLINQLHQHLTEIYLAGELRKKADMVRWNLNKIEDILFNAKIKGELQ